MDGLKNLPLGGLESARDISAMIFGSLWVVRLPTRVQLTPAYDFHSLLSNYIILG